MSSVALVPVVSEKAVGAVEDNVYIFEVPQSASKIAISRAVAEQFGVKVKTVNTSKIHGKPKDMRTKRQLISGRRSDAKRAYVTLAAGETIKLLAGSS